MAELESVYKNSRKKMQQCIEAFKHEISKIRTGKANISLLESITVDYYGQQTPLNHIGTISVPEARLIVIRPWEKTLLSEIEKAILASDIGITPQNDGNIVRLTFPSLTEDRRKELVKIVKNSGEDAKIAVRNTRRNFNDEIKQMEKKGEISEDSQLDGLDKIQEITDEFIEKIDEILTKKSDEIMEI